MGRAGVLARPDGRRWRPVGRLRSSSFASHSSFSRCQDADHSLEVIDEHLEAHLGSNAVLPKPMTSNAKAEGRFDKSDFIYIARDDEYPCPAGQRAIYRFRAKRTVCSCAGIGAARALNVRSRRNSRQAATDASRAGSMKQCSRPCNAGSTGSPRRYAAQANGRACVRNVKALDGLNALPDAQTAQRLCRRRGTP